MILKILFPFPSKKIIKPIKRKLFWEIFNYSRRTHYTLPRNVTAKLIISRQTLTQPFLFLSPSGSRISPRFIQTRQFCSDSAASIGSPSETVKSQDLLKVETQWFNLSFYTFRPIDSSSLIKLRDTMMARFLEFGILGRIYIATEGINAQMSCPRENIDSLRNYCDGELVQFFEKRRNDDNEGGLVVEDEKIIGDFNYSTSSGQRAAFRKLTVKIRNQIVVDGFPPNSYDLSKQPIHLSPDEWHLKLSMKPPGAKTILIDMRNHYESEIGYFENAIRPDVDTYRDSIKAMNEICVRKQDQEIFMYCTGGIRCSKAGAILRSTGFESVNVLKGGITAYGRYITSNPHITSLYKGRNFTFDRRLGEPITNDIVSECHTCGQPCDKHTNCRHKTCNLLFIQCKDCKTKLKRTCGNPTCLEMAEAWDKHHGDVIATIDPSVLESIKFIDPVFDDVKPGLTCWYDHGRRTRPRLVIERLGGKGHSLKSEIIEELLTRQAL
ncbi:hypothetical protein G9A89_006128 [Geosiphon pyriformis]|nr:hypothetical protein G9A89_006128 [Geosiphon pyriformis]